LAKSFLAFNAKTEENRCLLTSPPVHHRCGNKWNADRHQLEAIDAAKKHQPRSPPYTPREESRTAASLPKFDDWYRQVILKGSRMASMEAKRMMAMQRAGFAASPAHVGAEQQCVGVSS
jgi:hypothetical protein